VVILFFFLNMLLAALESQDVLVGQVKQAGRVVPEKAVAPAVQVVPA